MTHDTKRRREQRLAEAVGTARPKAHTGMHLHSFIGAREGTLGWYPSTDELLERASRALTHSRELIERGRALQERVRMQLSTSQMAIARTHCLLERKVCSGATAPAVPRNMMLVS